jgi:heptosyltransferase-3
MASLIYHAGALGDFITTLPAFACWREALPRGERLVLLGRPAFAPLSATPFDETWDAGAAEFAPLFSGSAAAGSPLAGKLGTISTALVFAAPSSSMPESLAKLGVREIQRQDPFPSSVVHVVDWHLSLFAGPVPAGERMPRIRVPPQKAAGETAGMVALHPGSGSAEKNWPMERFSDLAARLVERGHRIAWVLGPAETGLGPLPGAEEWRSLALTELAARLESCRLYVGNDSGVTHLAAATGCPTVALFGGSDPRVWAPRGQRVSIVTSENHRIGDIETARVLKACEENLWR